MVTVLDIISLWPYTDLDSSVELYSIDNYKFYPYTDVYDSYEVDWIDFDENKDKLIIGYTGERRWNA